MKKQPNNIVSRIFIILGLCLLVVAAAVLFSWQWGIGASAEKAETCVHTLRALLPEPQDTFPEERRDNEMPVLSIQGTDFVGILELPYHGSALPVCANWGDIYKYPCRLSGSVYDRGIQIGATSQKGQYDFYRELCLGDHVCFTDMEGNRFTYTITDIRYSKHADQEALQRVDAGLTLFIKNVYAFEYIIVFCDVLS